MAVARPATSRSVVFRGPGDLRVEDVPLPAPTTGEMVVRIRACGLCPGEVMDWYLARKAPVPLGHEPVGEVVEAGPGVGFAPGERVFAHHHAPCLVCRRCRRGEFVHCPTWRPRRLIPGGLATYALVQAPAVQADTLRVPASVSDEAATFIEPVACVVKSVRRARIGPGDRVLVIGLGVMGLLHLLVLRARREPVTLLAADRLPERLERAAALADIALDASRGPLAGLVADATGGDGADVVIVGPGRIDALEAGRAAAAPGGTVVVFAPTAPDARWPLPVHDVFFHETTIVPSYSAGPEDTREALRLLVAGLAVEPLITHRLPLDRAAEGYELIRAARALKVIVRPDAA
jgi:L-iditol 2-dehydrogenase